MLGGGLHVGVGAVADAVSRFSPQGREAALRASVAQLAEGRNVHANPVVRAEQDAPRQAFEEVTERPIGPLDDPLVPIRPAEFKAIVVDNLHIICPSPEFLFELGLPARRCQPRPIGEGELFNRWVFENLT